MSRFSATTLDLSNLPAPQVIQQVSFARIFAERRAELVAQFDAAGIAYDVAMLETDSAVIGQRVDGNREMLCLAAINDAAKATMLAFAVGADLDHLAALYGIARRVIAAATSISVALLESDAELRRRVQIAPEAMTTCGSEASYIHHALDAAPALIDAMPIVGASASGQPQVRVVCLARDDDGVPTAATLAAVRARLTRADVRPMTVPVSVAGATPVAYAIVAKLLIQPGPDAGLVRAAAVSALTAVAAARRGLGVDVLRQVFEAAARVSGVERVVLISPAADVVVELDQVGICGGITVTTEVIGG